VHTWCQDHPPGRGGAAQAVGSLPQDLTVWHHCV